MKFLSNVLSTIIGLILFFGILFFGLVLIGTLFGSSSEDARKTTVKENSVLNLDLELVSMDYVPKTVVTDFPMFNTEEYSGLTNILNAIEAAKTDKNIKGITMKNLKSNLGLAQAKALRDKLIEFKESGKFILSYADVYSQGQYYIGSTADTVYINPVGSFDFRGLGSEIMFFKDFQDKYGLKMEVIRHGKYKSAVEPFLENKMSEENRLQNQELLNSAWLTIVNDISKSRNISVDTLNAIANNLSARTPQMAVDKKLVDKIAYHDQYEKTIRTLLNAETNEDVNSVDITDYAANIAISNKGKKSDSKIAVIYAQGEIRDGEGDPNTIGEGYFRKALQDAVSDEKITAIVLRIDSPGGSALASDIMWREIEITKTQKPVVVSMGNLAASGGYYIACNAERIFAEPTTITGSIGVFGAVPNFTEFVNDKGVYADQVTTHQNSIEYSVFKPMTENFRSTITESIENIYDIFLDRVSKGRNMTKEQVNEVAQGRVWTGTDALRLGLVDEIGGLNKAIEYAAKISKNEKYSIKNFPVFETTTEEFFQNLSPFAIASKTKEAMIINEIGKENYQVIQQIKAVNSRKGIQAIMPYQINIK